MLQLQNLAEFTAGIDAWIDAVEELAEDTLRGLAVQAFSYVLQGTPEWTGNLVASWRLTVGAPAQGYSETIFKSTGWDRLTAPNDHTPSPFSRVTPNQAAISYAMSIAKEAVPLIRLGAPAYISNNAPYALEVELNQHNGRPFLRPVNLVDGRVEMIHAAADKFGALGVLSEAKALTLAKAKL